MWLCRLISMRSLAVLTSSIIWSNHPLITSPSTLFISISHFIQTVQSRQCPTVAMVTRWSRRFILVWVFLWSTDRSPLQRTWNVSLACDLSGLFLISGFFYKSPFASKWKEWSSLYCFQTSSFLGCGESVNPSKLNMQDVQGGFVL